VSRPFLRFLSCVSSVFSPVSFFLPFSAIELSFALLVLVAEVVSLRVHRDFSISAFPIFVLRGRCISRRTRSFFSFLDRGLSFCAGSLFLEPFSRLSCRDVTLGRPGSLSVQEILFCRPPNSDVLCSSPYFLTRSA